MKLVGNAIDYLLGGVKVGGADEARVRRWLAQPAADLVLPHGRIRYVVGDVETSGAGSSRNRLISIGAVAVAQMRIDFGDCFTTVLRQQRVSGNSNILSHGIGGQAQRGGVDPARAMLAFLEYLGKAPLVAFQAGGVRTVVERTMKSILGVPFKHPCIDLAVLLPALFPKAGWVTREEWLGHFGLPAGTWKDPVADAFDAARLLQIALDAANRAGIANARQLIDLRTVASSPERP